MRLRKKDRECAKQYRQTEPRFLGNLHERMKLVVSSIPSNGIVTHELRTALVDLETEVMYYQPINPPFGQRT